ncbi:carbamoyltransferase HypF [Cyanobium sp. FACHB-13342]|uniref:carbamoyltransferase HypF n=1 Tax=Cyanobium sp. FACHB-13342 TaxID=2692793 RepID=UPI001680DF59|nr:carbamoyltransferase HypF [Cyanobium sp. FACHB-13342]MBD2422855.1 carbamoyltransferase HypF [Cyanobium sp. FACHB-13342]
MSQARLRLWCRGVVQGVGFRPLVHRLASELALVGEVENVAGAVRLELQGERRCLELLVRRLPEALQPPGALEPLEPDWLPPRVPAPAGLRIAAAAGQPLGEGLVAPSLAADLAPCTACLAELHDPANRRHRYPFISCSACGPRYSIATAEPYARAHTSLAGFPLCAACQREFDDPADRRFHAETIGCPTCGPRLAWHGPGGEAGGEAGGDPLDQALDLLAAGGILALQGVGGFQLLVDASNGAAVARLRQRKHRPAKPLALLVADLEAITTLVELSTDERLQLQHPAAPIVLLRRRLGAPEALPGVAPGSAALGVMLPASPLHQLLAAGFGRPLVATSGNRSGEPLCCDPAEALERLAGIADGFLLHNRPIARRLDDSVLQVIEGRPVLLRRARGYAPRALALQAPPGTALAFGGDLKNAPALAQGGRVWLAPVLGDLAGGRQMQLMQQGVDQLLGRYGSQLDALVCDLHPGYGSHQLAAGAARRRGVPLQTVQHHRAHGLAVAAEHGLELPLLVWACDGLGYGDSAGGHRLWGGELLRLTAAGAERWACLRPFPLPGGERAMAEPRRAALGLLVATGPGALAHPGAAACRRAFAEGEWELLLQALATGCNTPLCSSTGRLFDAVASLLGLCQRSSFEGETGLRLEGLALQSEPIQPVPMPLLPAAGLELGWLDWAPLVRSLLDSGAAGVSPRQRAATFHASLAAGLAGAAAQAAARSGNGPVLLAGGCFQNRLLLERTSAALRAAGLEPYWAEQVPCNDGGLALGQLWAALANLPITKESVEASPCAWPPPA